MSDNHDIVAGWDGECFRPLKSFRDYCDRHLVVEERYIISWLEPRSIKHHRAYFAMVNSLYKSWPETAERQFTDVEEFRQWALIKTGWRDERQFVASSKAEAMRLAAFLRAGSTKYAEISVNGAAVVEWTAKSQNMRAMGKEDFARSADDVITFLCQASGTAIEDLRRHHASDQVSPRLLPSPEPTTKAVEATKPEPKPEPGDLTVDEAISILWRNEAKDVHNLSLGGIMIGATWSLDGAIEAIKTSKRRTFSRRGNHELFVIEADDRKSLFETDSDAVKALRKRKSQSAGQPPAEAAGSQAPPAAKPPAVGSPPSRPPGRLTAEQAIALLPDDGEPLGNLENISPFGLVTTIWERCEVERTLQVATDIRIAGERAKKMRYPLLVVEPDGRRFFFEADMAKVEKFEREGAI